MPVPVPVTGEVLAEQARDMVSGGRQGIIHGGRDEHLYDREPRIIGATGIEIGVLQVLHGRTDDDPEAVVICSLDPPTASEVRQFRQRHVHAQDRRLGARGTYATQELIAKVCVTNKIQIKVLRRGIGCDRATSARRTVGKHDAGCASILHNHFGHLGLRLDIHSQRKRFRQHRLADRAHPANRVAPRAADPVELAQRVMQEAVGGAGSVG